MTFSKKIIIKTKHYFIQFDIISYFLKSIMISIPNYVTISTP